ncbi:hemolysin-III channel protein Izh2 [Penicillium lividum]|nr:hemolysin-III channel protein Izh2 [Penicillium lividum]
MPHSPLRPPCQRKQPSPHTTKNQPLGNIPPAQQLQLLSSNDIPAWYSDNPYILTGYRPISNSTRNCLSSLFYLHNESINIYTHLIPSILFLLAEWTLYQYIQIWYPHAAIQDQAIFTFFLLTATICLGMSAIFHTLMNHSEKIGTLSALSLMVLINPRFQGLQWRTFRVGTFMAMGLSGIAPLVHGVAVFGFSQMMRQSGAPFYIGEGVLLGLGAVVYTTRVPESFGPGKFDIFGSSHQIFHVLVVLATILQTVGILSAYDYNYHNRVCDF